MTVHDLKLWKNILSQQNRLVPIEYWPYKTDVRGGISVIAEESNRHNGKPGEIECLVKKMFVKAHKLSNVPISSGTAVMCLLLPENGEGIGMPVYFVFFDATYTICTQIRSDAQEPVKIEPSKE